LKIVAAADLHLGAGGDYGAAPGDRLAEQAAVWRGVCQDAVGLGASLFLFCGDAFHRRRPSPAELLAFQRGLDDLRHGGVPVIVLAGNHDVVSVEEPSAIEVFRGQGVRVARRPIVYDLALGVRVACLPWAPPQRAMAAADDPEEARRAVAEDLLEVARGLRGQHEGPMIMVGHWSVSSARTPGGELVDVFREPVLARDELAGVGFDMVVLGHIHNPVVLHEGPSMFYCGSPVPVDFGEAEAPHGYWVIDWPRRDRYYRDARGQRRMLTFDYDVRGQDADVILFGSELPEDPDGAVVRVRIQADHGQPVDAAAVRRRLYGAGAVRVWRVTVDTGHAPGRASLGGVDEHTNPLRALSVYLEAEGVDDPVRGEAVALAETFMREADAA
jgi:exonuclease SbcD